MALWTDAQIAEAKRKIENHETLSDFEARMLRERGGLAGQGDSRRAMEQYDKEHPNG